MTKKSDIETLSKIDGSMAGSYSIVLRDTTEGRFAEETNFELYLKNKQEIISEYPVIIGKYYSGRGKYYRPWIEFSFSEKSTFGSEEIIFSDEALTDIFQNISEIIPPGGWIYVIYENHEKTMNQLGRQVPFPLTRIGYFLYRVGCVWFKDWYFSEGFREGRKKLQGEKYFDEEHRRERLLEMYESISNFFDRDDIESIDDFSEVRERGEKILREIEDAYPKEIN